MNIPNMSQPSQQETAFSLPAVLIIIVLAVTCGFWASRFFPTQKTNRVQNSNSTLSADEKKAQENLKVGQVYGNQDRVFKDTAVGIIEKGSINGEGTHILNRDGGVTQRASLTSSVVDLDIFVGRKVEVKGETNTSNKTSWLLDVGSIKILE